MPLNNRAFDTEKFVKDMAPEMSKANAETLANACADMINDRFATLGDNIATKDDLANLGISIKDDLTNLGIRIDAKFVTVEAEIKLSEYRAWIRLLTTQIVSTSLILAGVGLLLQLSS